MKVFCDHIKEETKTLYHMFPPKLMEPLMPEQWRDFSGAAKCHICLEHFQMWDEKVSNHCHYPGKYRGAAHQNCNLQYTVPHYIPIIFHNLSGYDALLFVRELGKKFDSGSIDMIAKNLEKYISFNVNITIDEYETPLGEMKQIKRQIWNEWS